MHATRQLCPRCYVTFETGGRPGALCASCAEAAPLGDAPAGAGVEAPRASARLAPAPASGTGAWWRAELDEAREWCRGESPWWRAALWLYIAWTVARHVGLGGAEPGEYRSLFDSLNFGIHELGHELFRPFGDWLHVAGGTLTQLAAPIAGLVMFRRQGDYFAISVAIAWLATNLFGIAVYMGDARARALPLASPHTGVLSGDEARGVVGHDWEFLLGHARLLHVDTTLAAGVHGLAMATMALGLGLGAWLIARMVRS